MECRNSLDVYDLNEVRAQLAETPVADCPPVSDVEALLILTEGRQRKFLEWLTSPVTDDDIEQVDYNSVVGVTNRYHIIIDALLPVLPALSNELSAHMPAVR